MEITEIKTAQDTLGAAFEAFKSANDARLKEIEKKGAADPLTTEKVERINAALDDIGDTKARLEKLETERNRALLGGGDRAADPEETKAMRQYLAKGDATGLTTLAQKNYMNVGADPDGGYLTPRGTSGRIMTIVRETTPMRQLATVETISTNSIEFLEDRDQATFGGWVGETQTRSDSNTPQVGLREVHTHEMYGQPKATQKLLDDAERDVEGWLNEKVADIFSRTENTAFITGTGSMQPRGILTYTAGTSWGQIEQVNSGSSGAVTADGLINLYTALKNPYSINANWLMARATVGKVRLLKEGGTNQYMWQPGLQAGTPDMLLGKPIVEAADMPAVGVDSLSIALGDFKRGYLILDRLGIRILRDPYTDKPFVKFYTTKRTGGDVINYEAIKIQKLA